MADLPASRDRRAMGIAATDSIWFVDNFRKVLGRIPIAVQVTACNLIDADGSLAMTNDQTPREGWSVYLRINGIRQASGKVTETDGCARWRALPPGPAYGVDEDPGGSSPPSCWSTRACW